MFNLDELNDQPSGGGMYIKPGVHEVTVGNVTGSMTQTGSPKITVELFMVGGEPENARKFDFIFGDKVFTFGKDTNMTSYKMSMNKLLHINNAITKRTAFVDAVTASGLPLDTLPNEEQLQAFAEELRNRWLNESFRAKIVAEEYLKGDGSVGIGTKIGMPSFAEPIVDTAEYPRVEVTKLTYDPTNQYDYKKLAVAPSPSTSGATPAFGSFGQ